MRGLATIQRIKLWKDRYSSYHCITFYSDKPSNRRDRRYREYYVTDFQEDLRGRDDKHKECRLGAIGRRGSAPNAVRAKSFHISSPSSWGRHRLRSVGSTSNIPQVVPLDIRWLGIRFSREAGKDVKRSCTCSGYLLPFSVRCQSNPANRNADYRRFMARWAGCHCADREFRGVIPLPSNHVDLPSPAIQAKTLEVDITRSPIRVSALLEPFKGA